MYIHILRDKVSGTRLLQFSDYKGIPHTVDPTGWEREALFSVDARQLLAAALTQDFEACGCTPIELIDP